jgi:hypothetical protein
MAARHALERSAVSFKLSTWTGAVTPLDLGVRYPTALNYRMFPQVSRAVEFRVPYFDEGPPKGGSRLREEEQAA